MIEKVKPIGAVIGLDGGGLEEFPAGFGFAISSHLTVAISCPRDAGFPIRAGNGYDLLKPKPMEEEE